MSGDDFEFVLFPNRTYWFVTQRPVWDRYSRILKETYGYDSFKILRQAYGEVNGQESTFVVIETGERPLLVSAVMMGAPGDWTEGQTAESLQAFETAQSATFFDNASELANAFFTWAKAARDRAGEFILEGALGMLPTPVGPLGVVAPTIAWATKVAEEAIPNPMKEIQKTASKVVMYVGAAAVVGLGVYLLVKVKR